MNWCYEFDSHVTAEVAAVTAAVTAATAAVTAATACLEIWKEWERVEKSLLKKKLLD